MYIDHYSYNYHISDCFIYMSMLPLLYADLELNYFGNSQINFIPKVPWGWGEGAKGDWKKKKKQAGADLCQAQDKLSLVVLNLDFIWTQKIGQKKVWAKIKFGQKKSLGKKKFGQK